jgi:hypothetical protein
MCAWAQIQCPSNRRATQEIEMIVKTLGLALIMVPSLAMAQGGQTPPTDPQSKRQQENPVVTGPAPAGTPPAVTDTTKASAPPINSTAPVGADLKATNDKKGPLQSGN